MLCCHGGMVSPSVRIADAMAMELRLLTVTGTVSLATGVEMHHSRATPIDVFIRSLPLLFKTITSSMC